MTPIRIAHVQPMTMDLYGHRDEELGDTVTYSVSNLAAAQARMGDAPTIHLLTSGRPSRREAGGVPIVFHRCLQPPRRAPISARFARQLSAPLLTAVDPAQADVVHFHGTRQLHLMFGAVGLVAARRGVPLVSQDRGNREVGRIETFAQRAGVRRSAVLLAASAESEAILAGMGGRRVHLVPNGYDPGVFSAGPEPVRGVHDPLRVLVVSRLQEDKDPLTMVAAMVELVRRGVRLELTVISRGPLRDEVDRRLRAGGVRATLVDQVPQSHLAEYYRRSDVFVLTSLREGFNQTVLEAMACGLPVVATDIGGTRDAVGSAGRLVPVGDPVAVADAVQALVADPSVYAQAREAAIARVAGLTWDAVAADLHEIYASLR